MDTSYEQKAREIIEQELVAQDFMEEFLRVRGFTERDIHEIGAENLYETFNRLVNAQ